MKYIITFSIIFSFTLRILGMNQEVDLFPELAHNPIARNFSRAILDYQKGNKVKAIPLLYDTYEEFQLNRLTYFIPEGILQKAYSILSIVEDSYGNFDKALFFSNKAFPEGGNNTNKGIIYRHKAKQALNQGNITKAQEYYQQAFRFFQGAALYDQRATKYYEHALLNGIGCTKNIVDIRKHYLDQVKTHYSHRIPNIHENGYKKALKKLLQFAEDDISTQCILAKAYSNSQDREKYGLLSSDDASLPWCEKAIINLVTVSSCSNYPAETISLFLALYLLCNNSDNNIKEKALILKKYFDILSAVKNRDTQKIEELCSNPRYTTLQTTVMNLIASQPLSREIIQHIKNITFEQQDFILFCQQEGFVVIPILKAILPSISAISKKNEDLFRILIGGYEYINHNFKDASHHFSQCTQYKEDFYLQALSLEGAESINQKIQLLSHCMQKRWKKKELSERDLLAQKIVSQACSYNQSLSAEEHLFFCEKFLLNYIVSTDEKYSFDYLRFLLSINDLSQKKTTIDDDIQKKAGIIQIYFDFFSALQQKDQQKINDMLFSPVKMRSVIFNAFNGNKKDEIKNIIFEDKEFQHLYDSDSFILIPLLEKILLHPTTTILIKPFQCHYLLGGFEELKGSESCTHFLHCTPYKKDLYLQTKIFKKSHIKDLFAHLENLFQAFISCSEKNLRNNKAKELISEIFNSFYPTYINSLLSSSLQGEFSSYASAYHALYYLSKFNLANTYQVLCKLFIDVETGVAQNASISPTFLNNTYRINTIEAIKKIAAEKNDQSCICNCLVSIFTQNKQSLLENNPDRIQLEKTYILKKYFDILSAVEKQHTQKIEELCANPQHTPLQTAVMNLIASQPFSREIIQHIKNITFEQQDFILFCQQEGFVAIPILKAILPSISAISQKNKDLFHILIGGYEYINHNFKDASHHFSQCTQYKEDFYLQALSLEGAENINHKIQLLSRCIQKRWKQELNERDLLAQKIVSQACNYNSLLPAEEHVSFCENFLLNYIVSTDEKYSFDYLRFLLSINDLSQKKTTVDNDIQKKASIIQLYFDFFSALQQKDQQKINEMLFSPVKMRSVIFNAFNGNKKDEIKNIIFEDKEFQYLYDSDSFLLIPLLEKILLHPTTTILIKPFQCHYLLGGFEELKGSESCTHFLHCTPYKKDLYLQTKIFKKSHIKDLFAHLENLFQAFISCSEKNLRNNKAKELIAEIFNSFYPTYINSLLSHSLSEEFSGYELAYQALYYLSKFNLANTYQTFCKLFIDVETHVAQNSSIPPTLLNNTYRINTIEAIKKIADEKNHQSCICDCLVSIFTRNGKSLLENNAHRIQLQEEYFKYLSCSLTHGDNDENRNKLKKQTCAMIALNLGIETKSHYWLDKAIELGNERALLKKAQLLSKQFAVEELLNKESAAKEQIQLLKKHAQSNDTDSKRALSLNYLGEYYSNSKKIKDKKKAFDCFKQAYKFGNYDQAIPLTFFYFSGIKEENGSLFQSIDLKKAKECITKVIEYEDGRYVQALSIRAIIHYQENQYIKALEDLARALKKEGILPIQEAIAYWFTGIIKIFTCADLPSITDDLNRAGSLLESYNQNLACLTLYSDEKSLPIVKKIIENIWKNKKTDSYSISFCSIIGRVLFEQTETNEMDENHQFSLKCLQYAANSDNIDAQLFLLYRNIQEISSWDKIYYLENVIQKGYNLGEDIQKTLKNLYPKSVLLQAELINYLFKKKPEILQKYISQLYLNDSPVLILKLDHPDFDQHAQGIMNKTLTIDILTQAADAFLANPKEQKTDFFNQFCAIFCGSLLCYADDISQLRKGSDYLERVLKNPLTISPTYIQANLAYIYQKLAKKYSHNLFMHLSLLKKSADLNNTESMDTLCKLWVQRNQEARKIISAEKITNCLAKIQNQHNPHNTSQTDQNILPAQKETTSETDQNRGINILEKQKKYPKLSLLVSKKSTKNAETLWHLVCNKNFEIQRYTPIKNPDCHMCLCLALTKIPFPAYNNFVQNYIKKALEQGIIISSQKSFVFKDLAILGLLCDLIECTLKSKNDSRRLIFLQTIKNNMEGINIEVFEDFYKTFYGQDLTDCLEWNIKSEYK